MTRGALKWTLLGCVVVYLLLALYGLVDSGESKPIRIILWTAILGLSAYLIATWKWRKTN